MQGRVYLHILAVFYSYTLVCICTCKTLPWYAGVFVYGNVNNTWQNIVLRQRNLNFIFYAIFELCSQRCDLSEPEQRNSIIVTENGEQIIALCVFINKDVLCFPVFTCLRSLWVAAFALTLLLSRECVSVRRLCSSALMPYWPQMAKAFSHAEFICGTWTTSSHTCPISHWSLNTKSHTAKYSVDNIWLLIYGFTGIRTKIN